MEKHRHLRLKFTLGSFFGLVVIGLIIFAIVRCTQSQPPTDNNDPEENEPIKHYVYFDLNGYRSISNPDPQLVEEGKKVMMPGVERLGYTLVGWTITPEGGTYWNFADDVVNDPVTLYAQWTKDVYSISFDLNGGTGTIPTSQTVTYLSFNDTERTNVLNMPATGSVSKEGYFLDGWWIKDDLGNFIQEWNFASDLPTSDFTLYAGWGTSGEFNHYLYTEYDTAIKITGYNDNSYVGGTLLIPDYISYKPVLSIGEDAFNGFMGTDEIALPSTITTIQSMAFNNCNSVFELVIPDNVTSIGNTAFANCSSLYEVTFGTKLLNIGIQAFYQCDNLGRFESIVFPSSLLSIEDRAFETVSPNALVGGLTFTNGVTYIGPQAFSHANITTLTLPNSVEYIGREAFCYTFELEEIHLGTGLLRIANHAFYMANNNTPGYLHVYIGATVPPELEDAQCFGPFSTSGGNPTRPGLWFIVPEGTRDAYNNDSMWGLYYHGRFTYFMIT